MMGLAIPRHPKTFSIVLLDYSGLTWIVKGLDAVYPMGRENILMVPGPTNVPERVLKAMVRPLISHRGPEFRELYGRLLENLKKVFQTGGDVYPLTASGTGGVECALGNLVSPGEPVITVHFGLFGERMREAVVRLGGRPVEVASEWGEAPSLEQVKEALDLNPEARLITIVYNETSTGVAWRMLPELGRLARSRDKILVVDAVSALAGEPLPVDQWNIDVCVAGSQKCLACPPGLSLISVNERAYQALRENKHRLFYFDLEAHRRFAERKETPFTPAVPLFYALDEALQLLFEEGLENRIKRHAACAQAFYEAFDRVGLETISKGSLRSNTLIAVWNPPRVDGDEMRRMAKEGFGVVIGGGAGKLKGKSFRIGSMGMVSLREVSLTLRAVFESLKKLNFSFKEKPERVLEEVEGKLEEALRKLPKLRLS
ncbi:MAG: aminotransferase [Candidatus Hecatellales archaeon]|nr:MAG: aminotransferase [Candidatus Hecatellales archaeon]